MAKSKNKSVIISKSEKSINPLPSNKPHKKTPSKKVRVPKKKAISKKKENSISNRNQSLPSTPKISISPPTKNYQILEKPQIKENLVNTSTDKKPIFQTVDLEEIEPKKPLPIAFIIAGSDTIRKKIRLDKIISKVRGISRKPFEKGTLQEEDNDKTMGMGALSKML